MKKPGKINWKLVRKARKSVRKIYRTKQLVGFHYHDIGNTLAIVKHVDRLERKTDLTKSDRIILFISAWFHDVGFRENPLDHETLSALAAEKFLTAKHIDQEIIQAVKQTILATKMPQTPSNLLEQILCDAEWYHLGTKNFFARNKLLRKEQQALTNKRIDKLKWLEDTLQLVSQHQFFTLYARHKLEKRKIKNVEKMKQKIIHLKRLQALERV